MTGETISFGKGGVDTFLIKLSPDGSLLWQKTWGGVNDEFVGDVTVDPDGNVYVTGMTKSFGEGGFDLFLLKFSPDGELLLQRVWGGKLDDVARGAAAAPDGSVYICGVTSSFLLLISPGPSDAFLLKFKPDGTLAWQRTWGGNLRESANAITVVQDAVYVTGWTQSSSYVFLPASGNLTEPTEPPTVPSGTLSTPTGTISTILGAVKSPSGKLAFAGEEDVFILKISEKEMTAGVTEVAKAENGRLDTVLAVVVALTLAVLILVARRKRGKGSAKLIL